MSSSGASSLIVANVLAPALYGIGLLSPLTPSEGIPSVVELSLFVGLPLAVLIFTAWVVPNIVVRVLVLLEAGAIAGFTALLLTIQASS